MDQTGMEIEGFRVERGHIWPDYDVRCAEVTFREIDELLPHIIGAVPIRRVAVQAGGNCGQLVLRLADLFGAVYTFEPHPDNFLALTVNTRHCTNVIRFQAVLGCDRGFLSLRQGDRRHPQNCGAWYAEGHGRIPTLAIDDLGLQVCDLIQLDVEGGELRALRGAQRTIVKHRPAVIVEEKGLGVRFYSEPAGAVADYLTGLDYHRIARVGQDDVWVPK